MLEQTFVAIDHVGIHVDIGIRIVCAPASSTQTPAYLDEKSFTLRSPHTLDIPLLSAYSLTSTHKESPIELAY